MSRRAGSADLPLHGGRVPQWLGARIDLWSEVWDQAIAFILIGLLVSIVVHVI